MSVPPSVLGAVVENIQWYTEIHTHPQLITHWLVTVDQGPGDHRPTRTGGHRPWITKCSGSEESPRAGGPALYADYQIRASKWSPTISSPHM